ncbi:hypothetical protein NJT12_18130 [Flavobacterium sp. AC]|uniref:Uncharacterized protein n=1 Tax=Flavobacterium azizsancarii TaxID=2961580 RepID=A0ABT4WG52_9FLAO|nr:hypothetical protein [Flavobacterium azizsancarii]MDA6071543.1 hypothetical protein [Flavobacterium azizsancarii]
MVSSLILDSYGKDKLIKLLSLWLRLCSFNCVNAQDYVHMGISSGFNAAFIWCWITSE